MSETRLPTDDQLWHCMSQTMRRVILPAVSDPWARAALIRLIGLAEYAPRRGEDPTWRRAGELVACLAGLAGRFPGIEERLPASWPEIAPSELMALCSDLLVDAIERPGDQAAAVQAELKPLLLSHLNEDLSVTGPLIGFFAGLIDER